MRNTKHLHKIISVCFVLFSCIKIDSQKLMDQQLYYFFDFVDLHAATFSKANNIQNVLFIDEHAVGNGKYLGLDFEKLENSIISLYPNILDEGLCYIDIESPYIDYLINEDTNSQKFKEALNYFIKIITKARSIRPNVSWGFYGIPFTTYWDLEKDFFSKYDKLKPLLEVSDVLFPSMYFFYSDHEPNGFLNEKFVRTNTQELIKIAALYSKPVFPFVMERFHPSNQNIGLKKIPENEFLKYINMILEESYEGKKVDGIVWWNADKFFYNSGFYKKDCNNLDLFLRKNSDSNVRLMKKILKIIKRTK